MLHGIVTTCLHGLQQSTLHEHGSPINGSPIVYESTCRVECHFRWHLGMVEETYKIFILKKVRRAETLVCSE